MKISQGVASEQPDEAVFGVSKLQASHGINRVARAPLLLEVADPNYTCTFPGTGSACKYQLSLQAGDAQTGKEFGNAPPAQIVSPEKITPHAYGRLIEDLQTELPASVAIALQRVVYVKRFARESRVGFGSAATPS